MLCEKGPCAVVRNPSGADDYHPGDYDRGRVWCSPGQVARRSLVGSDTGSARAEWRVGMAESHRTDQVRRDGSGARAGVHRTRAARLLGAVIVLLGFTGIVTAGVSCASATACTASGAYAPGGHPAYFLEAWNGRSWRLATAPHPAGFVQGALNGVSCARAGAPPSAPGRGGRFPWPPWPWRTDLRDP
jgi:hypothetical protein